MSLIEKIWGKKLPSEEYTKKSSWFSRFRNPLFWAGSVFTGGLIVVGVLTGLIIPFAVVAGVLGLLEVTGVLGKARENFRKWQLKKKLGEVYTSQYKSKLTHEKTFILTPTKNETITDFQNYENPTFVEQEQRWQAYGQQVLNTFSGDGEQNSPYETPFILFCACFPEKKRLDFSAFRCTHSPEKRQRWNHFIHQLLMNNPHLVDLAFHPADWASIDESIKKELRTRKACYVAEKISTAEQEVTADITSALDKEDVHLFYLSNASKRYAEYTQARRQQFGQLLSLSKLDQGSSVDYEGMNNVVNTALQTLNEKLSRQAVPTEIEQKKRPLLFELSRFFNASNGLVQSFKTVFQEIGERLSSLQLSVGSHSTDRLSHESLDELSPPVINLIRIDKNTPENERKEAFANETTRIEKLWGNRLLEGNDPGEVLEPELETVLCEILWGANSLCDWNRNDIDMLRQKQFMFSGDKRENTGAEHQDLQDKIIRILNYITNTYKTWYNLSENDYSSIRTRYLNNYREAFIGGNGGILQERQQLTDEFKDIAERSDRVILGYQDISHRYQDISHRYQDISHRYQDISHSYQKITDEAKQLRQGIENGTISTEHLKHLSYQERVAMLEQVKKEIALKAEARPNLNNDSEPDNNENTKSNSPQQPLSLSYGENPQNFYTSSNKKTSKTSGQPTQDKYSGNDTQSSVGKSIGQRK